MTTPTFLLSKKKVLEQYTTLRQLAPHVAYSSKTNPLITPILEEHTDALFSIHSMHELPHVKDLSRVLFFAQAWDATGIQQLFQQGIRRFVVDNETNLDTLLAVLEKEDITITLFLRLKLKENTLKTERYFVFGMHSDVLQRRVREINNNEALRKKIPILGLHFHRKTQNLNEWNYREELQDLFPNEVLRLFSVVNIGGGFPVPYASTNQDLLPAIFRKVEELRSWLQEDKISLMLEPGRFLAAPAVKLRTTILSIHGNTLIIDASIYNSNMDALIVPVKLLVEGELPAGEGKPYVIKGKTPCSLDLFRYKVYLQEPKVGDTIIFLNAGAYNFSTAFCNLPEIPTEVVE